MLSRFSTCTSPMPMPSMSSSRIFCNPSAEALNGMGSVVSPGSTPSSSASKDSVKVPPVASTVTVCTSSVLVPGSPSTVVVIATSTSSPGSMTIVAGSDSVASAAVRTVPIDGFRLYSPGSMMGSRSSSPVRSSPRPPLMNSGPWMLFNRSSC